MFFSDMLRAYFWNCALFAAWNVGSQQNCAFHSGTVSFVHTAWPYHCPDSDHIIVLNILASAQEPQMFTLAIFFLFIDKFNQI